MTLSVLVLDICWQGAAQPVPIFKKKGNRDDKLVDTFLDKSRAERVLCQYISTIITIKWINKMSLKTDYLICLFMIKKLSNVLYIHTHISILFYIIIIKYIYD